MFCCPCFRHMTGWDQVNSRQNGTANIAIGDRGQKPLLLIDDERNPLPALVDHRHGVADGSLRRTSGRLGDAMGSTKQLLGLLTCWYYFQGPGGRTHHDHTVRNIVNDDGTHANHHTFSDANPLADTRASADVAQSPNLNPAGQGRPRSNMHMVADHAIVFHRALGVQYDIVADHGSGIHHHACHDTHTATDLAERATTARGCIAVIGSKPYFKIRA